MKKKRYSNRQRTAMLIGALLIAMVLVIAAGLFIILQMNQPNDFDDYMEIAQKYVEEENYEAAIENYWAAIDEDDTQETAYIELGNVYQDNMDDVEHARNVFSLGYKRTESSRLGRLLDNAVLLLQTQKEADIITPNVTLLSSFGSYSYQDYKKQYGDPISSKNENGLIAVAYRNLKAVLYFDTNGYRTPGSSDMPTEIQLNDLKILFSEMEDSISYAELEEIGLDHLTTKYDSSLKKNVVQFELSGCKVVVESTEDGTISGEDAWNRIYPLGDEGTEERTLSGKIVNATTGEGVGGVELTLSSDTSETAAEGVTDSSGYYELPCEQTGDFVLHVAADGFTEEDVDVTVYENGDNSQDDIAISPLLGDGEIRIVLTWGSSPRDLDSYLDGTTSDGGGVHVSFMDRTAVSRGKTVAELDVDDMDGYGPETTTIYDTGGEYTFHIADFNRTGTLGSSGATVKIYVGSAAPVEYTVPSNAVDSWEVVKISKGKITPINNVDNGEWDAVNGKN